MRPIVLSLAKSPRIDATKIAPNLYQGSKPPQDWALSRAGFRVLVLAAREHQPGDWRFPGVEVIHVPLADVDRPLSESDLARVERAARLVALRAQLGKMVLVTCAAGLNRSGLIVGAALAPLLNLRGCAAVARVQSARGPMALSNPSFVYTLSGRRRCPRPVNIVS